MADTILHCVVVTPERSLLDERANFVVVPLFDGELGILPDRAPLVGRLGYGELRLVRGNETKRYYVDGGFVQVRNNVVTLLTSKAVKAEELNSAALKEQLQATMGPGATPEKRDEQIKLQQRLRAQIHLAAKVESGRLTPSTI